MSENENLTEKYAIFFPRHNLDFSVSSRFYDQKISNTVYVEKYLNLVSIWTFLRESRQKISSHKIHFHFHSHWFMNVKYKFNFSKYLIITRRRIFFFHNLFETRFFVRFFFCKCGCLTKTNISSVDLCKKAI